MNGTVRRGTGERRRANYRHGPRRPARRIALVGDKTRVPLPVDC